MNSKKSKQKKNRKKNKEEKLSDASNVFILPPNILEQLGIDLGSRTDSNEVIPTATCYTGEKPKTYTTKEQTNQKHNLDNPNQVSTSLTETAALMKNSVLLSPTFTNNATEPTSCNDLENTQNGPTYYIDTSMDNISITQLKAGSQLIEGSVLFNTGEVMISPKNKLIDIIHGNEPQDHTGENNPQLQEKQNTNIKTTQDMSINLIDIPVIVNDSNCNLISPKISNVTEDPQRDFVFKIPYSETVSNINVIEAEELLNLEKCFQQDAREVTKLVVPRHACSRDSTMNTSSTVSTSDKNEVHCQQGIKTYANGISSPAEVEAEKNKDCEAVDNTKFLNDSIIAADSHDLSFRDGKIGKISLDQNRFNKVDSKKTEASRVLKKQISIQDVTNCTELQSDLVATSANVPDKNTTTTEDVNTDKDKSFPVTDNKIKEIADYLSKCIKKTSSHSNRNKMNTKLSIHGVEKPGGQMKVNKSGSKTYKNKNIKVQKNIVKAINGENLLPVGASVNEIDYSLPPAISMEQVFCICYDFGLHSYTSLEEHVHFCGKTTLQIEKDVLFEMYNEVSNFTTEAKDETYIEYASGDEPVGPICWSAIGLKINNCNNTGDYDNTSGNDTVGYSHNLTALAVEVEGNTGAQVVTSLKTVVTENQSDIDGNGNSYQPTQTIKQVKNIKADCKQNFNHDNALKTKGETVSEANKIDKSSEVKVFNNDMYRKPKEVKVNYNSKSSKSQSPKKNEIRGKRRCDNLDVTNSSINQKRQKININKNKSEINAMKRKRSSDDKETTSAKKAYECGVCNEKLSGKEWEAHAELKHCYIAWHIGEEFDFEDEKLRSKLDKIIENKNTLECSFCHLKIKQTNEFINHVKLCRKPKKGSKCNNVQFDIKAKKRSYQNPRKQLQDHVRISSENPSEHELAPMTNLEPKIELQESPDVNPSEHELAPMTNLEPKIELQESSDVNTSDISMNSDSYRNMVKLENEEDQFLSDLKKLKKSSGSKVKCGVCFKETESSDWIEHICKEHKYIAWKEGESALKCSDENEMRVHLQNVLKDIGELVCYKCGLIRKQARAYIKHIKICDKNLILDFSMLSDMSTIGNDSQLSSTNKCGVCAAEVEDDSWIDHISKEHDYIAWMEGEDAIDIKNETQVRNHLHRISKQTGGLTCSKCGIIRKYAKQFMIHIKTCTGEKSQNASMTSNTSVIDNDTSISVEASAKDPNAIYKCGVCSKEVHSKDWMDHITKEHQYIAWKDGDKPLDTNNKEQIYDCLYAVSKELGGLTCQKCGITRKYVKYYMSHIEFCTGKEIVEDRDSDDTDDSLPDDVKCAVCKEEMKRDNWINHIEESHNYLAWWDIEEPLDLNNDEDVIEHLRQISVSNGGLKCVKCDLVFTKFPKRYLEHIKNNCLSPGKYKPKNEPKITEKSKLTRRHEEPREGVLECARCQAKVKAVDWRNHAMNEHYNITWAVGDTPINLRNQNAVDLLLKQYLKKKGSYKCKNCDLTRVSSYGFYAHIIVCGKSEEEKEIYQEFCNICNMKYLCVYKSQHMTAHKESELLKLRKLEQEEKRQILPAVDSEIVSGKRRAAQKAISVIENKSKNIAEKSEDFSDSDESVKLDSCSESESESDVDSDVSMKEHEQRAILAGGDQSLRSSNDINTTECAKMLPFDIGSKSKFLLNSGKDFREMYFTNEVLFPQWRCRDYKLLDKQNVSKYLPSLEESCLLDFGEGNLAVKKFEVKKAPIKGLDYFFAGATIRKVCWVPVGLVDNCDNYLTVVCHSDGDVPKRIDDELYSGPGSLQLWNCFDFRKLPFLSMVIIHDYGTIWSVSWCPSGARDKLKLEENLENEEKSDLRLGLMAVACSNGFAYIFSVPHPLSKDETSFYNLKPVAELRMTSNSERRVYQATSISWCGHKGHNVILVGYADGSIGYFDITNNSPLLTNKANGVDVFYPYYETRAHGSCITGVESFPRGAAVGLVCSGSPLGQALAQRGAAARSVHCADHALMSRHWPGAYAAGDSGILNKCTPHELELCGGGRRLGVVRALAECAACGHLAAFTSSQIRLMRPYPALNDLKKTSIIAIDLKHLTKKSKVKSDELGVVMEPLIYEDAIKKYAIDIKRFKSKSNVPVQPKPQDVCIERFPLNDVTSMDFCSSPDYHIKLAIGIHAGFVFILDTV